jgi:hypothetical protein
MVSLMHGEMCVMGLLDKRDMEHTCMVSWPDVLTMVMQASAVQSLPSRKVRSVPNLRTSRLGFLGEARACKKPLPGEGAELAVGSSALAWLAEVR